jgi:hypothetical protein
MWGTLLLGILLPFAYDGLIRALLLKAIGQPLPVGGVIALATGFLLIGGHFGMKEIASLVNAWHARGFKASCHRSWLAAQSAAGLGTVQAHLARVIELNLARKITSVLILPNGVYRLRFAVLTGWSAYIIGLVIAFYLLGKFDAV